MRFVQIILEVLSRVALLWFVLIIGMVFCTFVFSLFLPIFSKTLLLVSVLVAACTAFALMYAVFVKLDDDEKLWDYIPNLLAKGGVDDSKH